MRDTRLIFVDGLPGSGKTATASWLASRIRSERGMVNLFLEHQARHPLNVGDDLHPSGNAGGGTFFRRYTPERFVEESLERWQAFVHAALQAEAISVLDSYPFQNSVRVLLQLDATPDCIREHAGRIEALAMPMQPVLVYFDHRDHVHAFRHLRNISVQRGKAWRDYVVRLITHCPYAVARHLQGINGALAVIGDYRQLTDSLLRQSRIPRILLEDCAGGWEGCHERIEDFLGLD